jgi:Cu/Ag efflux protein CusF
MKTVLSLLILAGALLATPLAAQTSNDHPSHHPDQKASAPISEGEVRKVDKGAGKVTIKHGTLQNLDMPPMTMVFRVKDPAMLDQIKEGDRIRFTAEKIDGALTVTQVEVSK